jgi:hypothetical protein
VRGRGGKEMKSGEREWEIEKVRGKERDAEDYREAKANFIHCPILDCNVER